MNTIKLQADNINGVYKVEYFEGKVMDQFDFFDSLATNPVDSVICAEVDEDMYAKIDSEYDIH